jgi:hypothetical protein
MVTAKRVIWLWALVAVVGSAGGCTSILGATDVPDIPGPASGGGSDDSSGDGGATREDADASGFVDFDAGYVGAPGFGGRPGRLGW